MLMQAPVDTVGLQIPLSISDRMKGGEVNASVTFYQGGHLHITLPALPLIMTDYGYDRMRATGKVLEFSGVLMGDVEGI